MAYLRLLGGACLEESGEVLSGRAAQKRRLAILAVLAAAPGRAMSRDRIIGLIWPDKNEDQGRHLLSVAVYEIRKELGEDVVATRGDDLVLDTAVLPADIDAFDAALEAGDVEGAIRLSRGPFLDGFVLRGSVDFEHWLDATRERYASRYRRALEQLARQREAEGDRVGAVDAWRKLAAADRFNSRVALGLVRALAAARNRAGALEFARVHELLLEEEFGADPDPEFAEVVASIRAARPSRSTPPSESVDRVEPGARTVRPESGPERPDRPESSGSTSRAVPDPIVRAPRGRRSGWPGAWVRRALRSPRWRAAFLVAVAVGVLIGVVVRDVWQQLWAEPVANDGFVDVVVLPLQTADSSDAPWAAGLTDQLIETLAPLPGVRVPVRSVAFALRDVPPPDALRRLDADLALAGVARRDPERVSVRLELSGPEGHVLWAESYERPAEEVIRIATWEEIATAVQTRLMAALGPADIPAGGSPPASLPQPFDRGGWTDDPEAYELYNRGRAEWFSRAPDGFARAMRYYSRALVRDPDFARALVGMADVYNLMGSYDYGLLHPDSAYPKARRAAQQAIDLAPELHEAWAALAHTLYVYYRDWEGAERAYSKALSLNSRFAQGRHRYSLYLIAMGRKAEAMEQARSALQLDSLSAVMNAAVARNHYFQGDFRAALEGYEKARRLDPGFFHPHLGVGISLLALGRPGEAATALRQALDLAGGSHPLSLTLLNCALTQAGDAAAAGQGLETLERLREQGLFVPPEYDAILHMATGSFDNALDAFEVAFENNSSAMVYLNVHPLAAPLRDHPRFKALVERVGLPPRSAAGA